MFFPLDTHAEIIIIDKCELYVIQSSPCGNIIYRGTTEVISNTKPFSRRNIDFQIVSSATPFSTIVGVAPVPRASHRSYLHKY